jgi:hypothetical protein
MAKVEGIVDCRIHKAQRPRGFGSPDPAGMGAIRERRQAGRVTRVTASGASPSSSHSVQAEVRGELYPCLGEEDGGTLRARARMTQRRGARKPIGIADGATPPVLLATRNGAGRVHDCACGGTMSVTVETRRRVGSLLFNGCRCAA